MNKIELFTNGREWCARYSGPHAAHILSNFETDILPTAYLAAMPPAEVQQAIQKLNPGVNVEVR